MRFPSINLRGVEESAYKTKWHLIQVKIRWCQSRKFKINDGLKESVPFSKLVFNLVLENTIRNADLKKRERGVNLRGWKHMVQ